MSKATILIVARNAGSTINRAMSSAIEQGDYSVVLIDDDSSDDTLARAKAWGQDNVRIEKVASHGTLGAARQLGLELIDTEYGVLLDADDVLLPGRVDRLVAVMESEKTDAVFDELELWEEGNRYLKTIPIPEFIRDSGSLCRLFERNYLPGIGQMGFRAAFFRDIGYDKEVHGPEDTDIVLRAVMGGATFSLLREVGYRMYHGANTVSRDLERQNGELKRVLEKHPYERVADLYREAGYGERISLWARHSLATFRKDKQAMGHYLDQIECDAFDLDQVLEPNGPLPMSERWRLAFARGSLCLLEGDAEAAMVNFRRIASSEVTAEVFNNLGVANAMLGDCEGARLRFEKALEIFPGYSDASSNFRDPKLAKATYLPLRRQPSRNLY